MTDLADRFRPAKSMPAPDDWPRIAHRQVEVGIDGETERIASRPRARIGAAAVAIAASVAAAVLLWSAFGRGSTTPFTQSATPSPAPSSTTDFRYLFPFFREMDTWHVHDTGEVSAQEGAVAWASNVPFDPADLGPRSPAIPLNTIAALPAEGIVLTALVVPSEDDAKSGPWPPGSLVRPNLADATVRGPQAEEPPGDYVVYQLDGYALIRVYFGDPKPSAEALAAAQAELDTLEVPPTCPVSAEGTFPHTLSLSADTVSPGTAVTVTGEIPFQGKDGSYDRAANSVIELWWDADRADWIELFADPEDSSSMLLGSGGSGSCFLSLTITIPPGAPLGDHQIVAIDTDTERTGAFLYGTAVVHVTS